jgi:hypothetical protein
MVLRQDIKITLTGVLTTIAVHLVVLIIFLATKIQDIKSKREEALVIELDKETYDALQQMKNEKKPEINEIKSISGEALRNIAVNTANQLEEKISTEKYIEQLKQELNITDLNPHYDRTLTNDSYKETEVKKVKPAEAKPKTTFYKGPTRVEYHFTRNHRYIDIPIYKCEGGGHITVDIIVDQQGEVTSASIASTDTKEECILETALQSARLSLFDSDPNADPKEKGTITYDFVAQ